MEEYTILENCKKLLKAYEKWLLWYMKMPEDEHPIFSTNEKEARLCYFTLPMALNYQRNSYKLWEATLQTWEDETTRNVFDVKACTKMDEEELRMKLLKYKVALQPNKHIQTWKKIAETVSMNWWSISRLFEAVEYDFLLLQKVIQKEYKSWFPYLSGPKIFHYRSSIIQRYGGIELRNSEFIEIAPDTHVTQCSVKLGVISEEEAKSLAKEELSKRRREVLKGSWINPIDMHSPLWFWSRNNFKFTL